MKKPKETESLGVVRPDGLDEQDSKASPTAAHQISLDKWLGLKSQCAQLYSTMSSLQSAYRAFVCSFNGQRGSRPFWACGRATTAVCLSLIFVLTGCETT